MSMDAMVLLTEYKKLESENAALKKMIGEWANEMEPREDETSGDYAWRMGVLNLKMREVAK